MNKKILIKGGIVAGVLLGIGIAQYYLNKDKSVASLDSVKNKEEVPLMSIPQSTTKSDIKKENAEIITPKKASVFPLKIGYKGIEATQLQAYLLKYHGWENVEMGIYDTLTHERVVKFLKVNEVSQLLYEQLIHKQIKTQ